MNLILNANNDHPIDILLVEDNEADVKITLLAFSKAKIKNNVFVATDGQEGWDFLTHQGQFTDKEKNEIDGIDNNDLENPAS